jgi:hypothetical protein
LYSWRPTVSSRNESPSEKLEENLAKMTAGGGTAG